MRPALASLWFAALCLACASATRVRIAANVSIAGHGRASKVHDTHDACDKHSVLYGNIFSDLSAWFGKGITERQFHNYHDAHTITHIKIINNEAFLIGGQFPEHVDSLYLYQIFQLQQVLQHHKIPDVEILVNRGDFAVVRSLDPDGSILPVFNAGKSHGAWDILIPSGHMTQHLYDEWLDWTADELNEKHPWSSKRGDKVVARYNLFCVAGGAANNRRGQHMDCPRQFYNDLGEKHNDTLDIKMPRLHPGTFMSLPDLAKYKFPLDTDGWVAATRFWKLLAGNVCVLKHRSLWWEWFYAALQPWVHYVPINENDESDILEVHAWLRENDDVAERIAANAFDFTHRHLGLEGRLCYLRRLLEEYAALQRFEVKFEEGEEIIPLVQEMDRLIPTHGTRSEVKLTESTWRRKRRRLGEGVDNATP